VARRSRRLAVVGGIEAVRFTAPDPLARLEQLLDLEKRLLAERQQQALATYMMDVIGGLDGPPAALLPLRPRIERTHLPPAARQAVLDRLPHPGAAVAG
jgi:hypothetical protein